jgi:Flp pilus assembly protein TadG
MKIIRSSESGQAIVEFALTMPVLVLLLLGAAEFGRVAYASIEVSNAAKAAAQYAAQGPGAAGDTAGMQAFAQADAANLTGLTATSSFTCVCSDGTATTCANAETTCPGAGSSPETIITVQTQASINPLIYVPGLPKTYTLYGRAVQKCLGC